MAATVELRHKTTGKKIWRYSVDAKEILAAKGCEYEMTGQVKRSGVATPAERSDIRAARRETPEERLARTVAREVASAIAKAPEEPTEEPKPRRGGRKADPVEDL